MKNLKLNKGLSRDEMRVINGGRVLGEWTCTCGTDAPSSNQIRCNCVDYCAGTCRD